jgi:hypothetical protein
MSEQNQHHESAETNEPQGHALDRAGAHRTPLEQVKEQQAMQQESREAMQQRVESGNEIPGHGVPSEMRKHPQRRLG